MRERAALLAFAILAAGCLGAERDDLSGQSASPQTRPIVVALIDTGVTPYLPIFASDAPLPDLLEAQSRTFEFAREGSYDERLDADAAAWEGVEAGQLYWFNGTRLMGISFDTNSKYKLIDGHVVVHGTATSYLVARDAPDVLIVGIQVAEQFSPTTPYLVDPTVADAMEWIADQDWIDVVSISKGFLGNPPSVSELDPIALRYVRASERAAASGKIIVNAAGNEIVPSAANPFRGPPWIITVGGSRQNGDAAYASKIVDVVANYSETTPKPWTINETMHFQGTSAATPIVAATIAKAMEQVRAADPSIDNVPYRAALNATATYFAPTDWEPAPIDPSDPIGIFGDQTYPILLQAQMGWGYIDASMAPEIARRVIENDLSIPAGKGQAQLFQPRWQEARERYWAQYGS